MALPFTIYEIKGQQFSIFLMLFTIILTIIIFLTYFLMIITILLTKDLNLKIFSNYNYLLEILITKKFYLKYQSLSRQKKIFLTFNLILIIIDLIILNWKFYYLINHRLILDILLINLDVKILMIILALATFPTFASANAEQGVQNKKTQKINNQDKKHKKHKIYLRSSSIYLMLLSYFNIGIVEGQEPVVNAFMCIATISLMALFYVINICFYIIVTFLLTKYKESKILNDYWIIRFLIKRYKTTSFWFVLWECVMVFILLLLIFSFSLIFANHLISK